MIADLKIALENAKLKESLQSSENARSALTNENAELQSTMTDLKSDFDDLKKAKDLILDEHESLLQKAKASDANILELELEKSTLIENIASLESALLESKDLAEKQIDNLASELKSLKAGFADLEQINKNLKDENETLYTNLNLRIAQNSDLESLNSSLSSETEASKSE